MGNGSPGRLTKGAVEDEVVEGVGGPAARARELVQGDVGPEPGLVVRRERVAYGEPESGGGGVSRVARHASARIGVLVGGDSRRPKGVVGAVGRVEEGVSRKPTTEGQGWRGVSPPNPWPIG